MNLKEISDTRCPRTKAMECSCSKLKAIKESQEPITGKCVLEHSDTVKGTILLRQVSADQPTMIVGKITGLAPGKHGFHNMNLVIYQMVATQQVLIMIQIK